MLLFFWRLTHSTGNTVLSTYEHNSNIDQKTDGSKWTKVDYNAPKLTTVDTSAPGWIKVNNSHVPKIETRKTDPRWTEVDQNIPKLISIDKNKPQWRKVDYDIPKLSNVDTNRPKWINVESNTPAPIPFKLETDFLCPKYHSIFHSKNISSVTD